MIIKFNCIKYETSGNTQLVNNPTRAPGLYLPTSCSRVPRLNLPTLYLTTWTGTNLTHDMLLDAGIICISNHSRPWRKDYVYLSTPGKIGHPNRCSGQAWSIRMPKGSAIQTYTWPHDFANAHWDGTNYLVQRNRLTPFVSHLSARHSLEPLGSLQSRRCNPHTGIYELFTQSK